MKLYNINLEGHDVKSGAGLYEIAFEGRLNTLPLSATLSFFRGKLETVHTPAFGDDVYLQLISGETIPTNYYCFFGKVVDIQKTYRYVNLVCESYGRELVRKTESANDWYADYTSNDIADVMAYVIAKDTGLTQSRSGTVGTNVTGFNTGGAFKTDLLRRLCQMSYKSGVHNPFVFYEAGQTSYNIRCEPFGYEGTQTLEVGQEILGRPIWKDYTSELCNSVLVKYNGGELLREDATSISTYGRRKGKLFIYNVNNATDAQLIGDTFLWEWKDIRYKMGAWVLWKYIDNPHKAYSVLNKAYTITDDAAGKSSVSMVCNLWRWIWPGGKMYLEFGTIPFLTTDMFKDLEARVQDVQENYETKINVPSDTLQHSSDTGVSTTLEAQKKKTFTFTSGLPGAFRAKMDLKVSDAASAAYGWWAINGEYIGVTNYDTDTTYTTYSNDINIPLNPGDALEFWLGTESGYTAFAQNVRIYYDGITMPCTIT